MPVYDYLCSNCREVTEVIHGIEAPGPRFCPACGAEGTLRKAFAPPTVHFKGSGWAKKDRATASSKSRSKSDSGADSGATKTSASAASGGDSSGPSETSSSGSSSGGAGDSKSDSSSGSSSGSASSDAAGS